nr:hypothetical protein [Tanacetum cinerariifolium]
MNPDSIDKNDPDDVQLEDEASCASLDHRVISHRQHLRDTIQTLQNSSVARIQITQDAEANLRSTSSQAYRNVTSKELFFIW